MSTNDDSGSRRGRRPEQGEWRPDARETRDPRAPREARWSGASSRDRERSPDAAIDDRERRPGQPGDGERQNYSAFSRHSAQARPEPVSPRHADSNRRDASFDGPAVQDPQIHYPEPRGPSDNYRGPAAPDYQNFAPPLPPQDRPVYPNPDHEEDLYGRRPRDGGFDQDPYGTQQQSQRYDRQPAHDDEGAYRQAGPGSPIDDYDRSFATKTSLPEPQASRFFLPNDPAPAQRQAQGLPSRDREYQPPAYNEGSSQPQPSGYAAETYPARYEPQAERYNDGANWDGAGFEPQDQPYGQARLPDRIAQGDELDEDFFADEEDLDNEDEPLPKKRRTRLMAAALVVAIGAGGGTAYLYKKAGITSLGLDGSSGGSGTPLITADDKPAKLPPSSPGGRPFANGEKTIYDRLTPQGATNEPQSAALVADTRPPEGAGGKLLEDALRRARQTPDGQAPAAPSPRAGTADQPTIVQSERYGPDGKRLISATISGPNTGLPAPFDRVNATATGRPVILGDVSPSGSSVPQFVSPAQDASADATPSPRPRVAALSAPRPVAAAVSPAASGFFVQIQATKDQSAATRAVQALNEKYSAVLSDTPLTVKAVDKGDSGVWFREVAGPLASRQAATDLCTKLKEAGLSQCIVSAIK